MIVIDTIIFIDDVLCKSQYFVNDVYVNRADFDIIRECRLYFLPFLRLLVGDPEMFLEESSRARLKVTLRHSGSICLVY